METKGKSSKWLILISVVMVTFMSTLDGSIVNVALPVMAKSLHVTSASIQLVVTSYLICISAFILIFGRLGDMLGKTTVFKFGLALFTLSSLLCGVTDSFALLIAFRVLQAIGAAGSMANSQGIITEVFPPQERGKALGIIGTFVALGSLVGPPLGGFIVDGLHWSYIFLINVPVGIVTLYLCIRLLPKGKDVVTEKLDWAGSALFVMTIIPFFVAIGEIKQVGIENPVVIAGLMISVISFTIFLLVERKMQAPLLELKIFHNNVFSIQIICGFVSFMAIFCTNIIQPFYLQDIMKFSPSLTGLIMMVYPMILMVVAPVSGHLSDKIGSEILTFLGLLSTAIGLFCMSSLNENSSVPVMLLFIAFMSIGNGLFQSPNNSMIMSSVPRERLGIAGSVNALIRNVGMVCGISLATTILYNRMSAKIGHHVTDFVAGREDAFIYGMRIVYLTAGTICLLGAVLTASASMYRKRKIKITQE